MRQKGKKCTFFCGYEIYGVSRLNGKQILPNFDILMFEIGLLEADIFFILQMLFESLWNVF